MKTIFKFLQKLKKWSKQPHANAEDSFALTYIKAKAYNCQNQKPQAVDLLKSIIRIRPHYRSAQSLLTEILEEGQ